MIKQRSLIFLFCVTALLSGLAPSVVAEDAIKDLVPTLEEGLPYNIDAPSMKMDKTSGWCIAEGGVVITYGKQELRADTVRLNINTGETEATGNVQLIREGSRADFKNLKYNFKTKKIEADDFDLKFGPVIVDAGKGTKQDGLFTLQELRLTTCDRDHPGSCWHYHVKARKAEVDPDEYVKTWGNLLYFGRVPIFYFPYWYRDLDGDFGLTIEPGYESRHGGMLLGTYSWRFKNGIRSATHLDYRQKRGFGVGQDFLWDDDVFGQGGFRVYYLYDQKEIDEDDPLYNEVDENRYRVKFEHRKDVTERDVVRAYVHWLSDVALLEDFFEDEFRESRQPENQVSWNRWGDRVGYGVVARFRVNDFYDTVQRLPEAWLSVNRQAIGESLFYYESQSEAAYLDKVWSTLYENEPEEYNTIRADTRHLLSMPVKAGFLNMSPRVGARATYYAETVEHDSELVPAGITSDGVSYGSYSNDVPYAAGAGLRLMFDLGLDVSFKAYRVWNSGGGQRRHIFEPYADYDFVTDPNIAQDELYQFDEIDTLEGQNRLRLGVRNKLQRKEAGKSRTTTDVDLYAGLLMTPEGGEKNLDTLGMRARFRPATWLLIDSDLEYSSSYSALESFNARLRFWQKAMDADVEYIYRDEDLLIGDISSLIHGGITFRPSDRWEYNLFGRYEFEQGRVEEQGLYVQWAWDCLTFRVTGKVQPGYERDNGSEVDDDYKVSFRMWVNAFQRIGS